MQHGRTRRHEPGGKRPAPHGMGLEDDAVLASVEERFLKEKPLKGARMAACLHVTTETGN